MSEPAGRPQSPSGTTAQALPGRDPALQRAILESRPAAAHPVDPTPEEIAAGCEDGRIFADLHLSSLSEVPRAFPILPALLRRRRAQLGVEQADDIGLLWQWRDQASEEPTPERPFPVFRSVRLCSVAEATQVHLRVRQLRQQRLRRELGWLAYGVLQLRWWGRGQRDRLLRAMLRLLRRPDPTAMPGAVSLADLPPELRATLEGAIAEEAARGERPDPPPTTIPSNPVS